MVQELLKNTQNASIALRGASEQLIDQILNRISQRILSEMTYLLSENKKDLALLEYDNPLIDRLLLTEERLVQISNAIKNVSNLKNPSGQLISHFTHPNGIQIEKITVPLGVVGAIYESRPNVTYDIAALCLKSRNAAVLKGSKDAWFSNGAALSIIGDALEYYGLSKNCVTLLPADRSVVDEMIHAERLIDMVIPRGSQGLIDYVRKNSIVPVIETGAGVCHTYVHEKADLAKAVAIVINAKTSRPSVCNSLDTVIVDEAIAATFFPLLKRQLLPYKVLLHADEHSLGDLSGYPYLKPAQDVDFDTEFLGLEAAIKMVKNIDQALEHIQAHSTKHSECIVSEDEAICERFLKEVDAAAVYANVSTRFTDGEEFGLGAEIGISTQKLHARGPFALEKLVTEKWVIKGSGQIR